MQRYCYFLYLQIISNLFFKIFFIALILRYKKFKKILIKICNPPKNTSIIVIFEVFYMVVFRVFE